MTQTDERTMLDRADVAASEAKSVAEAAQKLAAAMDASLKAAALAWEYDYTITGAIAVNLALSAQRFVAPAAKAELGDLVLIYQTARPKVGSVTLGSFFLQGTGFVNAKGSVDVNCMLPPISVAGALSLPIRMRGFRPPAAT